MVVLRLFLYIICFLSIGWSVIVFGGPVLIKKFIIVYTDGMVRPSNITVSPSLDLRFGRLEYNFDIENSKIQASGFSRASEISWSLFNNEPFLTLDFGPTVLKNIATVDNIKVHTPPISKLDWQDLLLVSTATNLDAKSYGQVGNFNLETYFSIQSFILRDLNFNAETINFTIGDLLLDAELINGKVKELNFIEPINNQLFSGSFFASQITSQKENLRISNAAGSVSIAGEYQDFEVDLGDLSLSNVHGFVEKASFNGKYSNRTGFDNLKVDLINGDLIASLPSFYRISTEIKKLDHDKYNAYTVGSLREFQMYNSGNFLGILPPLEVSMNSSLNRLKSMQSTQSNISFKSSGAFSGSVKMLLGIAGHLNILACLVEDCFLKNFDLNYNIQVGEESVVGSSACNSNPCYLNTLKHSITTSNTATIFASLSQQGLLSPLSSLFIYNLVSGGKKIDKGHNFEF